MRFDIVTLFPDTFNTWHQGVVGRAIERQQLQLHTWNPRDFTDDACCMVDDRPYGGGPGMVMKPEPLARAVHTIRKTHWTDSSLVIHFSPQGRPLKQNLLEQLVRCHQHFILVATRYEGVDERFVMTEVDRQYSVGDYVLTCGELPCMLFIDGLSRLLPGVLGNAHSAEQDSFSQGLLDHPHYTRPQKFANLNIPQVLLSGDHRAIIRWRRQQSLGRTWLQRADLLSPNLSDEEQTLLHEFIEAYISNKENNDHA